MENIPIEQPDYKIFFKEYSKKFDDLLVLKGITFGVKNGEFLVIVGPTGCGKTTLVKLLVGLLEPTGGELFINGEKSDHASEKENFSVVFQEDSLLPWRTVKENIQLPLEIKKERKERIDEKVREMIQLLELEDYKNHTPAQLSRGMRQRVAIARSYVTNPDIIIMDEPFGHFDATSREHIERMIIEVWQKTKATIVFVTHNIEEAVYLAGRVLVLGQKPTEITEIIPVNLQHPRKYTSPEFIAIRRKITDLIRWW